MIQIGAYLFPVLLHKWNLMQNLTEYQKPNCLNGKLNAQTLELWDELISLVYNNRQDDTRMNERITEQWTKSLKAEKNEQQLSWRTWLGLIPTYIFEKCNEENFKIWHFTKRCELTFLIVSRLPPPSMDSVPLVQVKLSEEPLAEQVRTTVLLCSMISGRLDVTTTSDSGPAQKHEEVVVCEKTN